MIDWFTVGAQILNFALLVVLLRVFLYKPIVNAMQRRREDIEGRKQEAEDARRQAEEEREKYEEKTRQFDREREKLLRDAHGRADEERKKLVAEAREDADEKRQAWVSSVEEEKNAFRESLRNRLRTELLSALGDAMSDLADETLEARMAAVLGRRLRELDQEERKRFAAEVRANGDRVVVRTTVELSGDSQEDIVDALGEALNEEAEVEFDVDEKAEIGVTLATDGYQIGWTLADYLDRLESNTMSAFEAVEPAAGKEGEQEQEAESDEAGDNTE